MNPNHFNFWHKWLLVVSIFFSLMGLLMAIGSNSIFFSPHTAAMGEVFSHGTLSKDMLALRSFLFAPIGGTIAGYFLLQAFIIWGPFKRREPWSWHAVFWAMLLWFITDSGMSIYHGAIFNVWMVNIWTLFLIGFPLLMTRQDFK